MKEKGMKIIGILKLTVLGGLFLFGCGERGEPDKVEKDRVEEPLPLALAPEESPEEREQHQLVVATVNGSSILRGRLLRACKEDEARIRQGPETGLEDRIFRNRFLRLDRLVVEETLRLEAGKRGITVSDEEISAWLDRYATFDEIGKIRFLFPSLAGIETESEYREEIKRILLIQRLLETVVSEKVGEVTEEEVREYYEKNRESLRTPAIVDVFGIFINKEGRTPEEAQQRAKTIRQQLAQEMRGLDRWKMKVSLFARYAREYSDHRPSGQGGGYWVLYNRGNLADIGGRDFTAFEDAAYMLPVQTLSEVLEMPAAYFICMVERREERRLRDFDSWKDYLRLVLQRRRFEEFSAEFYKRLRDDYDIRIFRENIVLEGEFE